MMPEPKPNQRATTWPDIWVVYVPSHRGNQVVAKRLDIRFAQICRGRAELAEAIKTALALDVACIAVKLPNNPKRLAQLIDPGMMNEMRVLAKEKERETGAAAMKRACTR
jgi:hypothetical protein